MLKYVKEREKRSPSFERL